MLQGTTHSPKSWGKQNCDFYVSTSIRSLMKSSVQNSDLNELYKRGGEKADQSNVCSRASWLA